MRPTVLTTVANRRRRLVAGCAWLSTLVVTLSGGCPASQEPEGTPPPQRSTSDPGPAPVNPAPIADPESPVARRLGWLHGACMAVADNALMPGSAVTIVSLGDPPSIVDGRVVGMTTSGTCPALLPDRRAANTGKGWTFYRVDLPAGTGLDLGVGIVGNARRAGAGIDVSGDGVADTFTQCATSEGVRFAVWTGRPYEGTPLWSAYYYVGYDTEATCPALEAGR